MEFKKITDKKKYLKKNYPYHYVPELTDKKKCVHCGNEFVVEDFKVIVKDNIEYIVCPKAPSCDGDVTDWVNPEFGK
jgi:hypothetical protein